MGEYLQLFYFFSLIIMASIRGMYMYGLHCQYCAHPIFNKHKDLRNHESRRHGIAIEVNRRGGNASRDMELCTICNLFLDPGVSLAFSSHLRSSYHLEKLAEYHGSPSSGNSSVSHGVLSHGSAMQDSFTQSSGESERYFDAVADFESARSDNENDDRPNDDADCNKRLHDDTFDEATSVLTRDVSSVSHVDWMLDRNDELPYHLHPDIGYVFNCPFNFDDWQDMSKYPAAALEILNYGRYRFVGIILGADGKEV
jgi:hypothetical protein